MATPQETIEHDLKDALKAGEKERLSTLRMLLADIKNEKIRLGRDLDEDGFLATVRRGVKRRKDAETQFRDAGRAELADKEAREAVILEAYLPRQVGEDEIRAAVREFVEAEGLEGPKAMGPVMKAMKARFGATADGATLSRVAKETLSG